MSGKARYEDLATLLYLVPFIISGIYGLYLWAIGGLSAFLPSTVYLAVTRDPYVFVAGSLAVLLGVTLDVRGTEPGVRKAKLVSVGNSLQSIAIASLILVLVSALYANGFTDIGGAASDFIVGRYGLVFPVMVVVLSFLITARFNLAGIASRNVLGVVSLLLVPVAIYELGKRDISAGLGVALVLIVIGVAAYMLPERKPSAPEKE